MYFFSSVLFFLPFFYFNPFLFLFFLACLLSFSFLILCFHVLFLFFISFLSFPHLHFSFVNLLFCIFFLRCGGDLVLKKIQEQEGRPGHVTDLTEAPAQPTPRSPTVPVHPETLIPSGPFLSSTQTRKVLYPKRMSFFLTLTWRNRTAQRSQKHGPPLTTW